MYPLSANDPLRSKSHDDESSAKSFSFVTFDKETSSGGKQAEIIQLAAETKEGRSFSTFATPTTKEIPPPRCFSG